MTSWKEYLESNKERFLNELLELLRIPSISARSEHKDDMLKCAEAVKQRLLDAGVDHAEIFATEGHPVVFAEKTIDKNKPTVLVYGHYDVQPADPLDLWNSPPFEPIIKDGRYMPAARATTKDNFTCM
jgi:acetylornithine deacetylase/succinyl-diaminopimelate desuccinylase-like protein